LPRRRSWIMDAAEVATSPPGNATQSAVASQMRVEERGDATPGVLGRLIVVLRAGDAREKPQQQGGVRRVVVVHEAVTDPRIDLDVVGYLQLAEKPVEPLPGASPER